MKRITSVVIVPLFYSEETTRILFTRRNLKLKHHPGEISFPGGKVEIGETFIDAAKRETLEEINCKVVKVIGELNPVMTFVSDHLILPFIAYIDTSTLSLNRNEVESIHTVSVEEFIKTKMNKRRVEHNRVYIKSPIWQFSDFYVWGATGKILSEFKDWLKENTI
ncbi:MAG TPA: CoA pyrophosphatase [Bacteroidales bacterium]|nr:CoA pyrophosphatase [Bacteroidales bacterium]HPJ12748.1 CoA pyrophosphatase [Caldisericia bacterium]HRW33709.1 CoA pyrophosphatase [Thermotogota bacterium]